jgi:hypothetical protein
MALPDHAATVPRNRLLAALSPDILAALQLETVEMVFQKTLHAVGEPIASVYFVDLH